MSEYEKLYDKVLDKVIGPNMIIPGFLSVPAMVEKADRITNYIWDRRNRLKQECHNLCGKSAKKYYVSEVYETPWEDEPTLKHFCSEECQEAYLYGGDFAYFTCDICGREVCQQNPSNGWMVQYRYEDDMMYCLKCYEEEILANGHREEIFKRGQIPGMFLNDSDLINAGYEEVKHFENRFINNPVNAKPVIDKALELINNGFKIVVNYERMAIGGLEGYVTLWAKNNDDQTE
jgi:hypothetical protein